MWIIFLIIKCNKNSCTKKEKDMLLNNVATVRTGLPLFRKKVTVSDSITQEYRLLNLKCINDKGFIETQNVEIFPSKEILRKEYLTQLGDILIRLSAPYTAVLINDENLCGYVVPSHFAIIRVDNTKATSEYILWFLTRERTLKKIQQNSSGSTVLGTISSGFIGSLEINSIPLEKQKTIGQVLILAKREQELLSELVKQKEIYSKELINRIYNNYKRGN